ncbi:hypothetical protein ACFPK1_01995 [Actinomycetospora rhizophila]|uniref:Uncharacterized protein n=1 Tax=Actinomycetospora rhizophila TaxID=1416876 RepID=A0ABV9Z731_9PSEU
MSVRFAWPVLAAPPQVDLQDLQLDEAPARGITKDQDHLRVVLPGDHAWDRFSCRVLVATDEDGSVFEDLICYVVASSRDSATRVPFVLSGLPGDGLVEIHRDEIARDVILTVEVAAVHHGRRRVIGRSAPWTVVAQVGVAPRTAGGLPFGLTWVDFSSEDAPAVVKGSPLASAVMETTLGATPQLLLNSALPGLRDLLHADSAKLERRRLRDLLGSDVARLAVSSLMRAAAAEVVEADDGTVIAPQEDLHRQVCEAIAEVMGGMGSVEELYQRLAGGDSDSSSGDLWSRIDLAIDEVVGRRGAVATACEEIRVV